MMITVNGQQYRIVARRGEPVRAFLAKADESIFTVGKFGRLAGRKARRCLEVKSPRVMKRIRRELKRELRHVAVQKLRALARQRFRG